MIHLRRMIQPAAAGIALLPGAEHVLQFEAAQREEAE